MCEPKSYKVILPGKLPPGLIGFKEFPGLRLKISAFDKTETGEEALVVYANKERIVLSHENQQPVRAGDYLFADVSIVIGSAFGTLGFSICYAPLTEPSEGEVFDDSVALEVEALWKQSFADATLLPVVGLPSNNKGVLTLTHTDGSGKLLKINGLHSKSFLANNALYSSEITEEGKVLNLYETMMHDKAGVSGSPSSVQLYVKGLVERGLQVDGVHYHWSGTHVLVSAIHHSNIGLHPLEFSRLTIEALKAVL